MNAIDITVIVIVCAAVAAVVGMLVYRKLKRKGCGCGDCSLCDRCKTKKD